MGKINNKKWFMRIILKNNLPFIRNGIYCN